MPCLDTLSVSSSKTLRILKKNKKNLKNKKERSGYYESEIVHRRNSIDLQALESINLQRFIIC